jgi:hypothetical protein
MNEITYRQDGDYLVPEITIQKAERPIGRYGRMRREYLEKHRPILYSSLVLKEKLHPHLLEIEDTMNQRLEQMMTGMAAAAGITEELKASDPMGWVGEMNNLKASAEEILLRELIYR